MLLYYGTDPVDEDDHHHSEYVRIGFVPTGCKLGGVMIHQEFIAERDPCSSICPHVDRSGATGCGGRPGNPRGIYDAVKDVKRARNDIATARTSLTKQQCQHLHTLVEAVRKKA